MTWRQFKSAFKEILRETPLPNEDKWILTPLHYSGLINNEGWMEMLHRTLADFECDFGHSWRSSWSMIIFQFYLDFDNGFGQVRMKRFGQRCRQCKDNHNLYVGFCSEQQVWETLQCLLLYILQICYEMRSEWDADYIYYTIPVSNVPSGGAGGGSHQKNCCEACTYNRCQEKFKQLTKRK